MAEHERFIPHPETNPTPELIQNALAKTGELHYAAGRIKTSNAELVQKACVAQLALLEQDLRTQTKTKHAAGKDYSAYDEAISLLQEVIRGLRRRRDTEISDAISDLDPEGR